MTTSIDDAVKRFATILLVSASIGPLIGGACRLGVVLLAFLTMAVSAIADPSESEEAPMNADWLVKPHGGIGRLQFGLTPDDVSATRSVYGSPTPLIKGSDAAADLAALVADLGSSLSADDLAVLQQAAGQQANLDRQNLEKDRTPVLLEYRDGRLDGVTVEARHVETQFEGKHIFSMGSIDVLRLLERANGGPGRFRDNEAAFDHIAVSLFAFSHVFAEGEVHPATETDPDFRGRSLTLRRQPYKPAGELDQFVTVSFK